jgi:hypothetical protein
MAAMHVDNFVFILLVLVAMLFQLLTRLATKSSKRPRQDTGKPSLPPQVPRAPAETEEERDRKFLEELGQPTTSKPPPPVAPRPTYQKPVVVPRIPSPMRSPLPPLTTRPPEAESDVRLPREIRLPGQIPVTKPSGQSAEAKLNVITLLNSASGLRDAIILREIFGPPRSLQPLDLVGSV